jgi:hypothetical protein
MVGETAPDITLLTFQGTLLGHRQGNALVHRALLATDQGFRPLHLQRDETGALTAASPEAIAALGEVTFGTGLYPGTVSLRRNSGYASAEPNGDVSLRSRRCLKWESFLPLDADAVALLRHILDGSWMLPGLGLITPAAIRLAAGFSLCIGGFEIDLLQELPRAEAGGLVLTPRQGASAIASRVRCAARATGRPVIHVVPRGNTANRALQYLTAEAMRAGFPEAAIENVQLPEWGRILAQPAPPLARAARTGRTRYRIDVPGLADCLRRQVVDAVIIDGFTFNLDQYPPRAVAKRLLGETPDGAEARGFGARELVCSVRGAEILQGVHPNYLPLPPGYYRMLAEHSGLEPVFYGQLADDAYSDALRREFPKSRFIAGRSPGYDFDMLRRSAHLAPAISSFSWLAAWLGEAETVYLPVGGMFNPVQSVDLMFLPLDAPEYRYILLPYTKMFDISLDPGRFGRQQARLAEQARFIDAEAAGEIARRAEPLGLGRALVGGFDPDYYVSRYPDAAVAVRQGRSALDHYMHHAARQRRQPLDFDPVFYLERYPEAAMEIARGLHASPLRHFMAVGWQRGYAPNPAVLEGSGQGRITLE